jgi:hypothetical protein
LSEKLNEISGLETLNDSTLIALNDGGNKSDLFLLNTKGEILREVNVLDVKNHDWEDIAKDDTYIYIGDIGNNENKRENLSILKVRISDILTRDDVEAEKIAFSYAEQEDFPPEKESLFYDAEGIAVYKDSIWVFTKDRSQPFQGISYVYKLPTQPGDYSVEARHKLPVGKGGWWSDGITAVDIYDDLVYILTYNRFAIYSIRNGSFKLEHKHIFGGITQRESLVVLSPDAIFVADERNPLVGEGQIYKIKPARD